MFKSMSGCAALPNTGFEAPVLTVISRAPRRGYVNCGQSRQGCTEANGLIAREEGPTQKAEDTGSQNEIPIAAGQWPDGRKRSGGVETG